MVTPDRPQVFVRVPGETVGVLRPALLLSALLCAGMTATLRVTPIPAAPASPALPELQPVRPASPAPLPELQPVTASAAASVSVSNQAVPAPGAATSGGLRPADPLFPRQWDMNLISAPQAWQLLKQQKTAPAPVTVAVVDTGYIPTPELGSRLVNGYDFVSDPARAGDGNGRDADARGLGPNAYHAEAVSNIIGAAHDGQGMAGLNPAVKIVAVRVAGVSGDIDPVDLVDAIRWSVGLPVAGAPVNTNPARIVNLSLFADFIPLTGCDSRIQKAVDEATAQGALLVVGAGNDDRDVQGYSPAGCRNVLTVTSVDSSGQRPAYANWGANVALAAHGGDRTTRLTLSTTLQAGGVMTPDAGTSLATPHVTGVASLLLSVRPKLTPAQLKSALQLGAARFPGGRCDPDLRKSCGRGILNAEAALKRVLLSSLGK